MKIFISKTNKRKQWKQNKGKEPMETKEQMKLNIYVQDIVFIGFISLFNT